MPTRRALTVNQSNDETLTGQATETDFGSPLDLTDVTLEMLLKASEATPDDDPGVTTLSTTGGEITITDAELGTFEVTIPDTALTEAGNRWYRVDAIAGTSRKTIVYGPMRVRDL